jgi:hypothetical protein
MIGGGRNWLRIKFNGTLWYKWCLTFRFYCHCKFCLSLEHGLEDSVFRHLYFCVTS